MRRRTKSVLLAGVIVAVMTGSLAANALWSSGVDIDVPAASLGGVRFGAASEDTAGARSFSDAGAPVTVTLPADRVLEVLEQTSNDAEPVIWRFTASGAALGIAGINYRVDVTSQGTGEHAHDLSSGQAAPGTVLERSTMKVYRSGAGGDCSAVPPTPEPADGEVAKNVHLFDADDVQLQEAGTALDGTESSQEWCVAIEWNDTADGTYVNDVQVAGIADDGTLNGGVARWHAQVGFPPALEMLGTYRNLVRVEATAADTTKAQASAEWEADVYRDPADEPDIVISLDPIVTNVHPAVDPRD